MTDFPEQAPEPQNTPSPEMLALPHEEHVAEVQLNPLVEVQPEERLLFQQFIAPPPPSQERIPHMGHLGILTLLALSGLLTAILLARVGLYFHLFGISTLDKAATDIHYILATEGVFYAITFAGCLLLFPLLWHKGFLAGLQWNAGSAIHRAGYLVGAAAACFGLALVNGLLMPGPKDAPIDKMFRAPGAAWLLFAFGITIAPFFEELAFRGFLLPALATAFDWAVEHTTGRLPLPLHHNGHPRWSLPAMMTASLTSSLVFALMHADQTGYSLGPFLMLTCVSGVLCAIRLMTRSLAASVMVHACYNFLLFSLMFLGTSGFRHLENI
ncbi:MAG: CPBP family intramembrane metalloprotease [Terracidiphilus sp.]|nr:CPBP family intramembrane metalloprotease [Terracidiphilus sp.]